MWAFPLESSSTSGEVLFEVQDSGLLAPSRVEWKRTRLLCFVTASLPSAMARCVLPVAVCTSTSLQGFTRGRDAQKYPVNFNEQNRRFLVSFQRAATFTVQGSTLTCGPGDGCQIADDCTQGRVRTLVLSPVARRAGAPIGRASISFRMARSSG
jgi:hypothetical protein